MMKLGACLQRCKKRIKMKQTEIGKIHTIGGGQ